MTLPNLFYLEGTKEVTASYTSAAFTLSASGTNNAGAYNWASIGLFTGGQAAYVANDNLGNKETGVGSWTSPNLLNRSLVISSTSGGNLPCLFSGSVTVLNTKLAFDQNVEWLMKTLSAALPGTPGQLWITSGTASGVASPSGALATT